MEILIFGQKVNIDLTNLSWDAVYDFFGVKEFMHFIMNPELQATLFPAKVVFIFFTLFFLYYVVYFYIKSSYLYYNYFQGSEELMLIQNTKVLDASARWEKIIKKTQSGQEKDYKFAIIEADDFLQQLLDSKGFKDDDFGNLIDLAKKIIPNVDGILMAHDTRNKIVYDANYKLDEEESRIVLGHFEKAIKSISAT